MKNFKKSLALVLAIVVTLALFVTVGYAAEEKTKLVLSKEKDGLKAELTVTNDAASPEKIDLAIKAQHAGYRYHSEERHYCAYSLFYAYPLL